jgi:hypothetical protein
MTTYSKLAIVAKYHGPSKKRGARVKLSLPHYNIYRFTPFDHYFCTADKVAVSFLQGEGVEVESVSYIGKGQTVLLVDWDQNLSRLATLFGF